MRLLPVILAGGCAVRAGERRICFTLGFFGVLLCVMDWVYSDYDKKLAEDLGSYLGTSPILGALVLQRGYSDPIKARMFLNPKLADLDNPFRLKNLKAAALRIAQAIEKKEKILVFGDYDVDGITSTALLVEILRKFDLDPSYFVPRRMDEGYGLSPAALERALDGGKPDLLIALDCGTNAKDAINFIRSQDIDLLIVDHHQSKEELDDFSSHTLVNPHVFDMASAPWKQLCTVGLVFKLAHGLLKEMRLREDPRSYAINLKDSLDLVALGTVADLVPLTEENRILARHGIRRLKTTKRKGIQALIQASGISLGDDITPIDISFKLGPRINASGRLADASLPLDMLLGDDFTVCFRAACELNDINKERQEIERVVLEEAQEQILKNHLDEKACIVVHHRNWHPGVVGIIAGKLSREFHKPVIVFGEVDENGYTKGSGRSIAGLDFVSCLSKCTEFLGSWGGHPMAVGVSVKEDKLDEFTDKLCEQVSISLEDSDITPKVRISMDIDPSDIGVHLLDELEMLHPFGEGNREPVFAIRNVCLDKPPESFGNGQNYKFQIPLGENSWINAVAWRTGDVPPARKPVDLAVKLGWNRWNRRKIPQATFVAWRFAEPR